MKIVITGSSKYNFNEVLKFEKETDEFIGQAGLFHLGMDESQSDIEIAYRLHRKYWGKGYASELVRALIAWGFKNLSTKKLIAIVHPGNTRSHRVLKKFGTYAGKVEFYGAMVSCYEIYKTDAIELVPFVRSVRLDNRFLMDNSRIMEFHTSRLKTSKTISKIFKK